LIASNSDDEYTNINGADGSFTFKHGIELSSQKPFVRPLNEESRHTTLNPNAKSNIINKNDPVNSVITQSPSKKDPLEVPLSKSKAKRLAKAAKLAEHIQSSNQSTTSTPKPPVKSKPKLKKPIRIINAKEDSLADVLDSFTKPIEVRSKRDSLKGDAKLGVDTDDTCFFCVYEQFYQGAFWDSTPRKTKKSIRK